MRRFTADLASAGNIFPVKPKLAIANFAFSTADIASTVLLPVKKYPKQHPISKNKNWGLWRYVQKPKNKTNWMTLLHKF